MYPRNRPTVNRVIVMGNSTSDRGTFMKRKIFGFIPIRLLVSLFKKTHNGRFTNGYTWADNESAMLASKFFTDDLLRRNKKWLDNTDVSDALISNERNIKHKLAASYHLNNDEQVDFNDETFLRMYAEGGLTSAEYRCRFTFNPLNEIPRLIVSSLARQRNKLMEDDRNNHTGDDEKARTLVIEWSGGNDLITVNSTPNQDIAIRAINARIDNMMALIASGYRNFVLFTMPDLSLTPRFQEKSVADRNNAKLISDYFNNELTRRCMILKRNKPDMTIDIFDINPTLRKVVANPEKYGFDKDKTALQFIKSTEYKANKNNKLLLGEGYMFWDDIHPSGKVHVLLAAEFHRKFMRLYDFVSPTSRNKKALKGALSR